MKLLRPLFTLCLIAFAASLFTGCESVEQTPVGATLSGKEKPDTYLERVKERNQEERERINANPAYDTGFNEPGWESTRDPRY